LARDPRGGLGSARQVFLPLNCDIIPTGAINKPRVVACGYTIA